MPDDIELPEGSVEVARITIVKAFTDDADSGLAVYTSYSDDLGMLDALGMLAFAQATTADTFMGGDNDA